MEKDSIEAHGMGQFTKERMMETSDIANFKVCDDCVLLATKVIDKDYYVCNPCNNHTRISSVNMPYATKLLFQELMSINILPKIKTENTKFDQKLGNLENLINKALLVILVRLETITFG